MEKYFHFSYPSKKKTSMLSQHVCLEIKTSVSVGDVINLWSKYLIFFPAFSICVRFIKLFDPKINPIMAVARYGKQFSV